MSKVASSFHRKSRQNFVSVLGNAMLKSNVKYEYDTQFKVFYSLIGKGWKVCGAFMLFSEYMVAAAAAAVTVTIQPIGSPFYSRRMMKS